MEGRYIRPEHRHLDQTVPPSFLGLYTQLCLSYAIPDQSCHASIVKRLEYGLERLSSSFPYIAGQVTKEGESIRMAPLAATPRLIVKDFTNDALFSTMADYRAAEFPISMLDETVICPVNTLPVESALKSAPIFLVQINFIVGGMLLTFTAEHATMDMTGQAQIISLLSKACIGVTFTESELADGNTDRRTMIKLLDDYVIGPELDHKIKKVPFAAVVDDTHGEIVESVLLGAEGAMKEAQRDVQPGSQPDCVWAYFSFGGEALARLKAEATKSLTTGYVSTDDAITAFIWKSVARARLLRLSGTTASTLARAIDARRFVGISKTYHGLMGNMTYHTFPLSRLAQAPLGALASDLRHALDSETSRLGYDTRAYATAFAQAEDKSQFGPVINLRMDRDIALSSWANINSYDLDFGFGVGKPVSVRRPRLGPVESLMYLMPRDPNGDSAAAVCLSVEDMNAVKADREFIEYATYIG